MTGSEKKVSIDELTNPDIFDLVFENVERLNSTFIIYEDTKKTRPVAVLVSYKLYEQLLPNEKRG